MTFRGLLILLIIIIGIPLFMGKVSFIDFLDLLKNPGPVTGDQWAQALRGPFEQIVAFYKDLVFAFWNQYRPLLEKPLKQYKLDEIWRDAWEKNQESLRETLQGKKVKE